jgi:putative redox protein
MVTMTAIYLGALRTEATHLKSGNKIVTDAPPDNNGKGSAFSPTDLTCASLNSCMMTLMGMVAQRENISLDGLRSEIEKIMASNPRKIEEVRITFYHDNLNASDIQREKLKRAALTCPVALSLDEKIRQTVEFHF